MDWWAAWVGFWVGVTLTAYIFNKADKDSAKEGVIEIGGKVYRLTEIK